jgi:hypothetical protein
MKNKCFLILVIIITTIFSCKKEVIQYSLLTSVEPVNTGTISPASGTFENGQKISLMATPSSEYIFKEWKGDLSATSNPSDLIINSNKSITGSFEKRQYPLSLTISGNGTVKEEIVTLATQSNYPSGTTIKLTPQPEDKYEFGGWTGDITSTESPLILKIDKKISLNALFQPVKFMGYKVVPNAKQLGTDYWENTPVLSDLIIGVFQKNFEVYAPPQGDAYCAWTQAICNGDFNNDGYIDVFNAGSAFGGQKSRLSFLIWNPLTKIFDEKNLINNKTNFIGAPTKVSPIYLNDDNYVDLVIFGHQDESSPKNRIEPITVCLSDGKGGYDLTELVLQPPLPNESVVYEHGSVADLNGDKIPDLLIMANPRVFVFWGIPTFPYFTNKDYLVSVRDDFPFYCKIKDINRDGINDAFIGTNMDNQIFINDGKGNILSNKISVPYQENGNVFDYIVDDLNSDGLNDFINIGATNHLNWSIDVYIQQKDGTFKRDANWIENITGAKRGNYRNKLIYYDFDGDGKKDITYSDTGMEPYTSPTNEIKNKTVFIRTGNKFIEKDFFQFDSYAKALKDKFYK